MHLRLAEGHACFGEFVSPLETLGALQRLQIGKIFLRVLSAIYLFVYFCSSPYQALVDLLIQSWHCVASGNILWCFVTHSKHGAEECGVREYCRIPNLLLDCIKM